MTEDERSLWERNSRRDETARRELVLLYLPLVDVLARRIARISGARWEDLRQDGAIGLLTAIAKFDFRTGAAFRVYAKQYIRGAIFDSAELTRNVRRRQEEIYRRVRTATEQLTQTLQRIPTIEEVGKQTGLTIEQIMTAIDAKSVGFPEALPESGDPDLILYKSTNPEVRIFLLEAVEMLSEREREIISSYYWNDQTNEEIAQQLGLTVSNAIKIRQRAIQKLRKKLDVIL